MGVQFGQLGSWTQGSGGSTITSLSGTQSANAGDFIVLSVVYCAAYGVPSSVTCDGSAMTKIASVTNGGSPYTTNVDFYGVANVSAGSHSLAITSGATWFAADSITLSGVSSYATTAMTSVSTGATTTATLTVNGVSPGSLAVQSFGTRGFNSGNGNAGMTSLTGGVNRYNGGFAYTGGLILPGLSISTTTTSSTAFSATIAGATTDVWASVALVFMPAEVPRQQVIIPNPSVGPQALRNKFLRKPLAQALAIPVSQGSATGAYSWSSTATGKKNPAGSASGTYSWSSTATGKKNPAGSASGGYSWAGSATGTQPAHVGTASGTYSWAKTAASGSNAAGLGSTSGTYSWAKTAATGNKSSTGTASGTYAWASTRTGKKTPIGTASGTYQWSSTVAGLKSPVGHSSSRYGWSAPNLGHASGTYQWSVTAKTGRRSAKGSASGSYAVAGSAKGSHNFTYMWSGHAVGKRTPSGTGKSFYSWGAGVFKQLVLRS